MNVTRAMGAKRPPLELIDVMAVVSKNPFFAKNKFRQAFFEYRDYGLRPIKPKVTNARKELYYIKLRLKYNLI